MLIFISENVLRKIKNNFVVCDQYKIMQRIVCWFLFVVYRNAHVSSNAKKTHPEPASFSSVLHCWTLEKSIFIAPYPHLSLLSTLPSGFTQHCGVTVLSGLPVPKLNDFFFPQAASLFLLCLCSIYTIEQPFLDSVSSLQDVFLAVTESNHITLT